MIQKVIFIKKANNKNYNLAEGIYELNFDFLISFYFIEGREHRWYQDKAFVDVWVFAKLHVNRLSSSRDISLNVYSNAQTDRRCDTSNCKPITGLKLVSFLSVPQTLCNSEVLQYSLETQKDIHVSVLQFTVQAFSGRENPSIRFSSLVNNLIILI